MNERQFICPISLALEFLYFYEYPDPKKVVAAIHGGTWGMCLRLTHGIAVQQEHSVGTAVLLQAHVVGVDAIGVLHVLGESWGRVGGNQKEKKPKKLFLHHKPNSKYLLNTEDSTQRHALRKTFPPFHPSKKLSAFPTPCPSCLLLHDSITAWITLCHHYLSFFSLSLLLAYKPLENKDVSDT